jgi:hypothetical protein
MARRHWKTSVSLESDTQPVRTIRTVITAGEAPPAARLAIREAFKAFPRAQWRSLVVVLEKMGEDVDGEGSRVKPPDTAREDAPGSTNGEASSPLPRGQIGLDVGRRTSRG